MIKGTAADSNSCFDAWSSPAAVAVIYRINKIFGRNLNKMSSSILMALNKLMMLLCMKGSGKMKNCIVSNVLKALQA